MAAEASPARGAGKLPALTPEYLSDIRGFARRFFRSLYERFPAGATYVFDNYQELPAASRVHELLVDAIECVPAGSCVVLISRSDLPPCFSRLLINERVTTISAEHLRVTPAEAGLIGADRGVRDDRNMNELCERADGWAAGLTLLLEQRADELSPTGRNSPELLFHYFASQIFESIPDDQQQVLLKTAVLPTVTQAIAAELTGTMDAPQVLANLYQRRMFIHRHSTEAVTYQYHALFREFLLERARQSFSPDAWLALRLRAAELLEANGRSEDAVGLYLECGAWESVTGAVLTLAPRLLAVGRWQTLQEWLLRLPADVLATNGWAMYWLGLSYLQTASALARDWLVKANNAFIRSDDTKGRLLAATAIIRSIHFEYRSFAMLDDWAVQLGRDLAQSPDIANPADELAIHTAVLVVTIYRQPDNAMHRHSQQRVTELLDGEIDVNHRASAAFVLLLANTVAHENEQALRLAEHLIPIFEGAAITPLNRAYWHLLKAYLHLRRGDRAESIAALDAADRIASENSFKKVEFLARCYRTQTCIMWMDIQGARRALLGLERHVSNDNAMDLAHYHKQHLSLEMACGDAAAAAQHARLGVAAALRLGSPFFAASWLAQGAAALGMAGELHEAETWLDRAWAESERGFVRSYQPLILAVWFYVLQCCGAEDRAREKLRALLALIVDEDTFSYIGTMPPVRDVVLRAAIVSGFRGPRVDRLIRKYELAPLGQWRRDWPWTIEIYTLGAFRIKVYAEPLQYSRKTPRKVLQLLKALVAMGGTDVPMSKLVDSLWPDEDGDAGMEALSASLHRLRRLLNCPDAIVTGEGVLSINKARVWVDLWCLEEQVTLEGRRVREAGIHYDDIISLYSGHFLATDEGDAAWVITPRERARNRYLAYLHAVGSELCAAKQFDAAARLYQRGIEVDELAEDLYQGLIRALIATGNTTEAARVYQRLRATLAAELGVCPSFQMSQLV